MYVSPPVIIEDHSADKKEVAWLLSFGGSNPEENVCMEFTKTQCCWLHEMIMRIDPNLFARTREMLQCSMSQTQQG